MAKKGYVLWGRNKGQDWEFVRCMDKPIEHWEDEGYEYLMVTGPIEKYFSQSDYELSTFDKKGQL